MKDKNGIEVDHIDNKYEKMITMNEDGRYIYDIYGNKRKREATGDFTWLGDWKINV